LLARLTRTEEIDESRSAAMDADVGIDVSKEQ
jgi:hypothetical protein